MPLAPYSGTLGHKGAAHLLRRATFGATRQDIDTFAAYTVTQAITNLFQATPEPSAPVEPGAGSTWVTQPPTPTEDDNDLQGYLRAWCLGQVLTTNVAAGDRLAFSTRERIVFFLHTALTTIQETVNSSRSLYYQNVLFRKFAFDSSNALYNYKNLVKKICIDNAMLVLLDGRLNVKGNPNENFARELLELYTIGKGLEGYAPVSPGPGDYTYYTELDVQQAAKVLSGWDLDDTYSIIDPDTGLPRGKVRTGSNLLPNQHDDSIKQFSVRLGSQIIQENPALLTGGETTEASMLDELDQLLNLIFNQTETHKRLCRKIYRFYTYHEITPALDSTIIQEMVNTLVANNFKIEPVIRELLSSQHFFDNATGTTDDDQFGALIKSPLDLVSGTLSFFEYQMPDYLTQTASFYEKAGTLLYAMNTHGMNYLNPYDVAGYESYHQYPLFNRHWITTNSLTQRYKFIFDIMSIDNMMSDTINIDLLTFIQSRFAANALDPDAFIRELASYLLPMYIEGTEITTARLDYFKSQFYKLGTGLPQGPLAFWTFSWTNAGTIPASEADARGMLQDLVNAMLQSPEYQLM